MSEQSHEAFLGYPLFANLENKLVVVIGGGAVAERKILSLLDYRAKLRIISPELTEALELLVESGICEHERRVYQQGDLLEAWLVVCACADQQTNRQVFEEADKNKIFVNVVDVPEYCSFYVPSIVRRDPLQIAISTAGSSPVLAREIRKELELQYPQYYSLYLQVLAEVREIVKQRVLGDEKDRKPLLEALVASDLLEKIKEGVIPEAEDVFREYIVPAIKDEAKRAQVLAYVPGKF